ncbi:HEPN domain-containing protein [Nocardia sp. NPDC058705]|uniref:HEPN domain-containing protein n=1 Tax=Nocardia sp. NPDC058705 TaxID=3346609 RepID=UPI0036C93FA6
MTNNAVNTAYNSPFICTKDHESADPVLCLSRANFGDPTKETFEEFAFAAGVLIKSRLVLGQPAFFMTRQVAELALKALLPTSMQASKFRHDLEKLLTYLQGLGDDLFAGGTEQTQIVEFIRELNRLDPGGDGGRYSHTTSDAPALAGVCHAEPDLLLDELNRLVTYTATRLGMQPFTV